MGANVSGLKKKTTSRNASGLTRNSQNYKAPSPVATRKQQGGTCWFHAAVNGLLMSVFARKIIKQRIKENKISSNYIGGTSCFSRKVSKETLWEYMAHRLKSETINSRIKNKNVIIQSGIRKHPPLFKSKSKTVDGGTIRDIDIVYSKLFGNDFSYLKEKRKTTFVIYDASADKTVHETINHLGTNYVLSHSYITLYSANDSIAHAVAGYRNKRSQYKVFDSRHTEPRNHNWHNINQRIQLLRLNKRFGKVVDIICIYINPLSLPSN